MPNFNVQADVNKLMEFMVSGAAEDGERKFFNDWQGRDQYARQHGTFDHGRRSEEAKGAFGITIGRNYYAWSALGALRNGIHLDSNGHFSRLWATYKKN
jgi:hypothetical protein